MRLSDVKGERTLDVVADIIGPVTRIARDDDAMELFRPKQVPDGMTSADYFAQRAAKAAPAILKGHRDDVIAILSSIEGVSPEEYKDSLNLAKLLRDVVELMTDEAFLGFLPQNGSETASSGDVSELTLVPDEGTHSGDTSQEPTATS